MSTVTSLLEQEAGRLEEIAAAVKAGVMPGAYASALSHIAGNLRAIAAVLEPPAEEAPAAAEELPAAAEEAAPAAAESPRMAALRELLSGGQHA
jgi:hypothetical protein